VCLNKKVLCGFCWTVLAAQERKDQSVETQKGVVAAVCVCVCVCLCLCSGSSSYLISLGF